MYTHYKQCHRTTAHFQLNLLLLILLLLLLILLLKILSVSSIQSIRVTVRTSAKRNIATITPLQTERSVDGLNTHSQINQGFHVLFTENKKKPIMQADTAPSDDLDN